MTQKKTTKDLVRDYEFEQSLRDAQPQFPEDLKPNEYMRSTKFLNGIQCNILALQAKVKVFKFS